MSMTRYAYCERILRQIYGGMPTDDAQITINLVNNWLNDALGIAARNNYKDNYTIEGVNFVNNSFYTSYTNIPISAHSSGVYKISLPQIPVGLGYSEGISTIQFVDTKGKISRTAIPLSVNQVSYMLNMRPIPNKTLYYSEGIFCYILSSLILTNYTANVKMISGGDSTDINSIINIPDDYFPDTVKYIREQLLLERSAPQDHSNDGNDN